MFVFDSKVVKLSIDKVESPLAQISTGKYGRLVLINREVILLIELYLIFLS